MKEKKTKLQKLKEDRKDNMIERKVQEQEQRTASYYCITN